MSGVMVNETEEGKKVAREGREKYWTVWRRIEDPIERRIREMTMNGTLDWLNGMYILYSYTNSRRSISILTSPKCLCYRISILASNDYSLIFVTHIELYFEQAGRSDDRDFDRVLLHSSRAALI